MGSLRYYTAAFIIFLSWNVQAKSPIEFDEVSKQAGIEDQGIDGAGIAFWDYDEDGDVDVYINNSDSNNSHLGLRNRLYENDGNGHFRDVAEERGVLDRDSSGRGISWGDYDNDGDTDLLLGNMSGFPTQLYKNLLVETGAPNFENVTRKAGLMRSGHEEDQRLGGLSDTSGGIAWADYNNDSFLDVLWRNTNDDIEQVLFRNNGDGTFTEVTNEAGVRILDYSLEADSQGSSGWFDFDQDGHIDLLSPNEGHNNVLFHNNGDGTFTEVTRNRQSPSGIPFFNEGNANGVCLGDIDNDGDIDAYLPNADQANRLIRNNLKETGEATFTDITKVSGTGDMGGARGCTMADYDNDGFIDIYVSNGGPSNVLFNDIADEGFSPFVQFYVAVEPRNNVLYHNNGDGTFTDVTDGSGAVGFSIGVGVASGDVNGDGFMDIIATGRSFYTDGKLMGESQQNFLFLNKGNRNNWIKVRLKGTTSNRSGFNARVKVVAGDLSQTRELYSTTGYNSQDDPTLNFGLARQTQVDFIEVIWPSGKTQRLENLKPRQVVTITEPE